MSGLIEGLPDSIALRCLAQVPFYMHPRLELVSRSWQAVVRSPELFKVRQEVGSSEDLLCVSAFEPENLWQLYDPLRDLWITLPLLPSRIKHLTHCGVASISWKLFVIGGISDDVDQMTGEHNMSLATNEVWSYDLVTRQWTQRAPMLVPRARFACCVLDGKIVVASGFTRRPQLICKAEMYYPERDVWVPLPDLHRSPVSTRSGLAACSGLVFEGKVYVLHKGEFKVHVLDESRARWMVEDLRGWRQGLMAVVRGALYVMRDGHIVKGEGSEIVASATKFRGRNNFGMIGMGGEVYVIGGVIIIPDGCSWDVARVSDVDVLTVGDERPAWRRVAPARCHGTIVGCTVLNV